MKTDTLTQVLEDEGLPFASKAAFLLMLGNGGEIRQIDMTCNDTPKERLKALKLLQMRGYATKTQSDTYQIRDED